MARRGRGWYGEPRRHSKAARGIKTALPQRHGRQLKKLQRARFPFLGLSGPVIEDVLEKRALEVAQGLRDIGYTGVEARLEPAFGSPEAWVVVSDDMGVNDPGKMHPIVAVELAKKAKGKPHMQVKQVKGGHEIQLGGV